MQRAMSTLTLSNPADELFNNIGQLNRKRLECEKSRKFLEAAKLKEAALQLGPEYKDTYLNFVRNYHSTEREKLIKDATEQKTELENKWETLLKECELAGKQELDNVLKNQGLALQKHVETLRRKIPPQGKFSPTILDLEVKVEYLMKTQSYIEADQVQQEIINLKNKCLQQITSRTENKIQNLIRYAEKKLAIEYAAVQQKVYIEYEELLMQRDKEVDTLVYKSRVAMDKLTNCQKCEYARVLTKLRNFNPISNYILN